MSPSNPADDTSRRATEPKITAIAYRLLRAVTAYHHCPYPTAAPEAREMARCFLNLFRALLPHAAHDALIALVNLCAIEAARSRVATNNPPPPTTDTDTTTPPNP